MSELPVHEIDLAPCRSGCPANHAAVADAFFDGDPSVTLSAIPSCVADGEAPRYPPVQAGEWLMAKIVSGQSAQPVDLHEGGLTGATNR